MLPAVGLFVCHVKNVLFGFLVEKNPQRANFQLARVAQRCSQSSQLCFSPNAFKTSVGWNGASHEQVREHKVNLEKLVVFLKYSYFLRIDM